MNIRRAGHAVVASALCFFAAPVGAHAAATILNGSFETNASSIPAGGFTTVFAGDSTTIADWTVDTGSVDWVGTYWQAANGIASIDLSGNGPGSISQTITGLTTGHEYQISFWLAGNPDGGPANKTGTINVTAGPSGYGFAYPVISQTRANMDYVPETLDFTATGASTVLTFASTTATAYGPVIDNVSIASIPEASTWVMMVLGFAGLGYAGFRSRKPSGSSISIV
jgi:choice-of-anchor C domain-containing protein